MKVILFGATGMVGQGVLKECLDHPDVTAVLALVRSSCEIENTKLEEIVHRDFFDYSGIEDRLTGYDACFFCLGVSSAGMSEETYHRLTYELTLAAAETLVKLNPGMTFCYVSGAGTDSTESGSRMWSRVKGKTENHLLKLPFKAAFMFRPGYIQPMKGIRSKTRLYQTAYTLLGPLYPLWKKLFPDYVTTTEEVGLAMINVVRRGYPKQIIESRDINELAGPAVMKTEDYDLGSSYSEADALGTAKSRPELATPGVELHGDALLLGDPLDSEGHFCIRQNVNRDERTLTVDAHFDWHLGDVSLPDDVSGRELRVFKRTAGTISYLGRGHVGMTQTGGGGAKLQVRLLDLTPSTADQLVPSPESPMDGAALAEALRQPGVDRFELAEAFARSWLGELPPSQPPAESRDAVDDVRRWHALWARVATFEQFPYCCWPASWRPPDEEGISYFQDEWQNGATFGHRGDGVWIHAWATRGRSVRCARDVGEFALQFLIYGMVEGTNGRFMSSERDIPGLERLPLEPWRELFSSSDVEFVGGSGLVGVRTGEGTTLCVTASKFAELCA